MNGRNESWLYALALAGLTVALGFMAWWTFVIIAFAAAFYFAKSSRVKQPVVVAMLGPAFGWLLTAIVRDITEGGRISAKLATLLHVRFAPLVYLVLFLIALIPSFFAAFSGAQTSKALR